MGRVEARRPSTWTRRSGEAEDDLEARAAQIPGEGSGAHAPERAIEAQAIRRPGDRETLGQVGLVDVPGGDVLLDPENELPVLLPREAGVAREVGQGSGGGAPERRGASAERAASVVVAPTFAGPVVGDDAIAFGYEEAVHRHRNEERRGAGGRAGRAKS